MERVGAVWVRAGRRSHSAPRAGVTAALAADRHDLTTPSAGTTRGATSEPRLPSGRPSGKRDVRCIEAPDLRRLGGWRRGRLRGSEQPGRDRQVAGEVGERLGPSTAGPGRCRAGSPRRARSRPPDPPAPPAHIANAPRGYDDRRQVPEHRPEQRLRRGPRPVRRARPRRRSRSRPASPSGPRYSQPWRDSERRKRWSTGWATPSSSAIERVDGVGQQAMTLAVRRTGGDLLEGERDDARRQLAEGLGTLRQPGQVEERHPRDHPELGVQGVRDRLGAVRRDRADHVGVGRQDPVQQLAPEAGPLEIGQHEQHRQVPQPIAHGRGRERDDLGRARRASRRR